MTNASVAPKEVVNGSLRGPRTGRTFLLQVAIAAQQRELMDRQRKAEIGARIKELRERSPYTQPWLAARLNVTPRAYQKWEAGGGTEYENYERLAEIHGVHVDYILKGETPDLFGALEDDSQLDRIEATVNALHAAVSLVLDQLQVAETHPPAAQPATPLRRTRKRNGGTGTEG